MTTETTATPAPQLAGTNPPHVTIHPSGLQALKLYEHEVATYLRELPGLLAEGHAGRHALVKGDEVLSIWDTDGDATQAGRERFGLEPIFIMKVDPRDPERFALVFAQLNAQKESPCPSSTTETTATPAPQPPATKPPHITIHPSGLQALKLYEHEVATYLRELPGLLAEGHAGRHALVKGDEILSIWDTQGDAIQAGCERFGLEPIFVKTIDSRDTERFALVFAQLNAQKDSPCPSS